MKTKYLLLLILLLTSLNSFGQAKFKADSIKWHPSPKTLKEWAFGTLYFTNTGTKPFKGSALALYKTRFENQPNYASFATFKKIDTAQSDSLGLGIYVDHPYFKGDTTNIVVVWPTGNGIAVTDSLIYKFYVSVTNAIQPFEKTSNHLRLYPNPAEDIVNMDYRNGVVLLKEIKIFDESGKAMQDWSRCGTELSVERLAPGSYILVLQLSDGTTEKYKLIRTLTLK
jgi:hypothetical protein